MAHGTNRGFVMVTMLCCLVVLVAFLGLAIDAGYLELMKTRIQTAADAAAVGGAQELKANGTANVTAAARFDAALNGFTDGSNGVTVTVNTVPANSTAVEVIVGKQQVSTWFMSLVGSSSVQMQARAVARLGNSPTCVYLLDQTADGAFTASGGADVEIGCGVMVDSGHATAFTVSGGTKVNATAIGVFGGYTITGGSTVTPGPVAGMARVSDPLAYIPAPAVTGCQYLNTSIGGGQTVTLYAGVYCNGITIGNGAHVTFAPVGSNADFILVGGGLDLGGGTIITGTGTFYNTSGTGYPYKQISFHNGAQVTLNAPTTGPRAGILLFQDRAISSGLVNTFTGGTLLTLNGSLYFPTTSLSYSGGTDAGTYSIIVARTATFAGGCKMHADYSLLPGGSPLKGSAILSE